ncbi:hypothetical protein CEXT_537381 [Caerostris extrusa]|uniref:Methyltransferase type 11 domain-containing protein n=1 Tax=Caerostris extrusa TaxID=172846 RepID=A0AAV4VJ53_CAEEX|nr:hypothetical protein CEXT_537381 [Caerostris extrusa]
MSLDLNSELYYQWHEPFESVLHFFKNTLLQVGWGQGHQKRIAMDVGCGPGGTTTQLVLPLFPRLEKVIAVDLLPHMIDIARKHHFSSAS